MGRSKRGKKQKRNGSRKRIPKHHPEEKIKREEKAFYDAAGVLVPLEEYLEENDAPVVIIKDTNLSYYNVRENLPLLTH